MSDGTLWGWGRNDFGQLGLAPGLITNSLTRIGTDADWIKIFASQSSSVGVKRDGSVWKWGLVFTHKDRTFKSLPQHEPVLWKVNGMDWREYITFYDWDLILKEDGSLWTTGNVRPELFGSRLFDDPRGYRYHAEVLRVGNASDWSAIGNNLDTLTGLKRNGLILQFDLWNRFLRFWKDVRRPSQYSDWIAINETYWGQSLTLAADGTLCAWPTGQTRNIQSNRTLLGPTRKPVWTANIFNNSSQGN